MNKLGKALIAIMIAAVPHKYVCADDNMTRMKSRLEQAIAKISNNTNNYCRIQKDADKNVVACVIYYTMPAGKATSEQEVTRITLNFDGSYQPTIPVTAKININGYNVNVWQEKQVIPVYPPKEITVTSYVVNFNSSLQMVINCDSEHPCYAESLLRVLD